MDLLPHLDQLALSGNRAIGDEGLASISRYLETSGGKDDGAGVSLRTMKLQNVGASAEAKARLRAACRQHDINPML